VSQLWQTGRVSAHEMRRVSKQTSCVVCPGGNNHRRRLLRRIHDPGQNGV